MLDELMGCLAPCFARVEPRRQARKYVTGLISDWPPRGSLIFSVEDRADCGRCSGRYRPDQVLAVE